MVNRAIKVSRIISHRVKSFISSMYSYCFLRFHGVETRFGFVTLLGKPIINKHPKSRIILGRNVTIVSDSKWNVAGINHPAILATLSPDAGIVIGDNSGMSGGSICAVRSVTIGRHCGLGANCNVYDTDFHPLHPHRRAAQRSIDEASCSPVIIEDHVWLSANVTVLKGVRIGENAVVAAGAVVVNDVGANELHGGIPAIKIREILT